MTERTKHYRQKRDFGKTPEPSGAPQHSPLAGPLRFVVQKHDATRLHYDFRLEHDGVLKSWAVTKQPTGEVGSRRLAIQTEDHPLEYAEFEGEIPEGEYGAGSVVVWDSGTWTPEGDPARGFQQGKINFELAGSVLQGRWTLVRFGQRGIRSARKDNWLLIKRHDAATPRNVLGAVKRPMGEIESPQLATLVLTVPAGSDWWFEPKLDGYRLLARVEDGDVKLTTRKGNDWTNRFEQIAKALRSLPCRQAWLDGEVVVFDSTGVTHFQSLQTALSNRQNNMHYVIFDLLHFDEWDLRSAPLSARKSLLRQLLSGSEDPIRYGDHIEGDGARVLANVCDLGLEGIIAKQVSAPYVEGRSRSWLKLKCSLEQEFVIVGFTDPRGARQGFGALLVATRDDANGQLRYAGRVGTGFDRETLQSLRRLLRASETSEAPVPGLTKQIAGEDVHWVVPEVVAQVSYAGWTNDRRIRHAVFHGLREDKGAKDVEGEGPGGVAPPIQRASGVRLSNPNKLLYSDPPVTKRALADYWSKFAPLAFPFIAERPLMLLRCPDGIGECFYQKHVGASSPKGILKIGVDEGEEPYAMVDHERAFIGLVQWGTIELHTWGARAAQLEQPDTLVFDLDPSEDLPWSAVVAAAEELKSRIEALGLVPFVKLTGGKGLHIVIPVIPGPNWDAVKVFARAIATELARAQPNHFTVSISKSRRAGKIFIDYLRNDRGSTAIAPYSPRATEGAPIAVPITWSELLVDRTTRPVVTLDDIEHVLRSHKRSHPWRQFDASRRSLTE